MDRRACFGVIVVLVGFSLEIVVRIVIPMVEYNWNGSTCGEQGCRRVMRNSEIISPSWSLASLRHGRPILGVSEHSHGAGEVVVCCCSFDLNLI